MLSRRSLILRPGGMPVGATGSSSGGGTTSRYRDAVLADNPVAYWRLGDAVGPTVTAQVGSNLAAVNAPTFGVAGLLVGDPNTAMTFVAASSQSAQGSDAGFPSGNTPWSIDMLVKCVSATEMGLVIWGTDNGSGGASCFALFNGLLTFDTATFFQTFGAVAVNNNVKHHIALTWDGTTMLAYADGVQVGAGFAPGALALILAGAAGMQFAHRGAHFYDGTVDEPAIYASCLTPARIAAHSAAAS